jgi:hypothetical protein
MTKLRVQVLGLGFRVYHIFMKLVYLLQYHIVVTTKWLVS